MKTTEKRGTPSTLIVPLLIANLRWGRRDRGVPGCADRRSECTSEGRWVVVGVRWRGWGEQVPAGWSGGAGDAGGCGDVQGAVGVEGEGPAGAVGFQPVVAPAQAAQVLAGG